MPIADLSSAFARVALANVARAYPRRLDQLLGGPDEEWRPGVLHPAFYGSYDWHSAVHMHWLLARLLRLHPAIPERSAIEERLDVHLNASNLARELAFFNGPGGTTFERPYGWAWLLELQAELVRLRRWHGEVAPLADELADRFVRFLEASAYPVRAGTHGNTAFASILALDYARTAGRSDLAAAVEAAARRRYLDDRDYPVAYEPSGDDFLSPALIEALLMKRVLPDGEFSEWLKRFLPPDLGPLSQPPTVADHADAKQSHLDGLCLSRAWCFEHLGKAEEAKRHLEAGMPHVVGGDFAGEHWLASFALLALSAATLKTP
ncbi:MAG TPA: DUF2891 domain-containing protein [Burkholderiales bacterium]|nr:DUF2891 domain-containing protein [Burkholderiales bacterium]